MRLTALLLFISSLAFGQANLILTVSQQKDSGTPVDNSVTLVIDDDDRGSGTNLTLVSGTWTEIETGDPRTIGGTIIYNNAGTDNGNTADDPYVQVQFEGTKVEWIAQKYPHHGISAVSIDGGAETMVDAYSVTPEEAQVLFTASGLSAGTHTIKVRNTGTKNAASTDDYTTHDAFRVNGAAVPPVTSDATYFVAQSGCTGACSDNNNGLTRLTAFATIQKAASVASAGQIVEVYGGTYRETITPTNSGVSGSPITYRVAAGETVIISGLTQIDNGAWTVHSGSIYKATMSMPTRNTIGFGGPGQADQANAAMTNTNLLDYQIFDDGVMQIEARWPKGVQQYTDLFKMTATGSSTAPASTDTRRHVSDMTTFTTTQITDNALNVSNGFPIASGGLVGAVLNTHGWFIAETRTISTHSGTTITFPGVWNDTKVRKYYWLTGKLGFLTQQREFHYESGTLYFWAAGGGAPTNVEFKARNWGFDLKNRSYIKIRGFTFKGVEPVMGNTSTTNCEVDNIRATHTNHTVRLTRTYWQGYGTSQLTGVKLVGANNVFKNSEISWGGSQGVWIGTGGTVQNNKIEYYGYDGMWGCGVAFWGEQEVNNIKVLYNSIGYMGRGCIDNGYAFSESDVSRSTKNNEIGYNDMYQFCFLNQDGGVFYSWGWQNLSGSRFHHNWLHDDAATPSPVPLSGGAGADGIMAGFYMDMGSGANVGQPPFTIDHNVFWRIGWSSGWIDNDWADIYSHPGFVQNSPEYPDYTDRVAKQPGRFYNNTFWGDRKSYVTYQPHVGEILRNNIYGGDVNNNWGNNPISNSNSLSSASNPLFSGGSLSTPASYFQLQSGSPARNIGTTLSGYNDGDTDGKDSGAYYFGITGWTAGYTAVTYTP